MFNKQIKTITKNLIKKYKLMMLCQLMKIKLNKLLKILQILNKQNTTMIFLIKYRIKQKEDKDRNQKDKNNPTHNLMIIIIKKNLIMRIKAQISPTKIKRHLEINNLKAIMRKITTIMKIKKPLMQNLKITMFQRVYLMNQILLKKRIMRL